MPSARELLEQADALMRRNRSPLMDDIPVLTDAVPEVRPGRPARLRPALPERVAPDTVPMLTEHVSSTPSPAAVTPAVPVVDEGEASDWLQLGGEEPSVIGEEPDSIAMVPPFEGMSEEIEVEAPPELEASFDEELAERASEAAPPATPTPEPIAPAAIVEVATPAAPEAIAEAEPLPAVPADIVEVEPPPAVPAAIEEVELPSAAPVAQWSPESDTIIDEPEVDELAPAEMEQPVELSTPPVHEGAPIEDAVEAGPSPAERQADEDARWAAIAEEIRMQVLQRIDLFTDTGLRDQLGARLQPIVDRASADLVRTINQHVGELLRSYVAEAIEREIENWRRGT